MVQSNIVTSNPSNNDFRVETAFREISNSIYSKICITRTAGCQKKCYTEFRVGQCFLNGETKEKSEGVVRVVR